MADMAVNMVDVGMGMLLGDMPPAMSRLHTLVSVRAVDVFSVLPGCRVETRAMHFAHIIGMGGATGAAVIGEVVTGIRPMDILGLVITAWAMAIHITDIIRGDTILTVTDIGLT